MDLSRAARQDVGACTNTLHWTNQEGMLPSHTECWRLLPLRSVLAVNVLTLMLFAGTLAAQTPERAGTAEPGESRLMERGYLNLNTSYQGGRGASIQRISMPLYDETAVFDASYPASEGLALDVGAGLRVWRSLAIGIGITRFRARDGVAVTASIPHPLFFNRPREWQHRAEGYQRTELGVHLHAVWTIRLAERFDVSLSAGPSLFVLDHDRVSGFVVEPPGADYDAFQVTAGGTDVQSQILGTNAAIDLTYHFVTNDEAGGLFWTAGIGVYGRWSQGTKRLGGSASAELPEAGGAQVGAGLRFRF